MRSWKCSNKGMMDRNENRAAGCLLAIVLYCALRHADSDVLLAAAKKLAE